VSLAPVRPTPLDRASGVPVLSLRSITKTFPGTRALDSVNLDVAEGEIHALVGQNGSGKSTLIKVLAGYHLADRGGRAVIAGSEINLAKVMPRHDRLRFVHQDLGLFLELSAVENLALRSQFITGTCGLVRWRSQAEEARRLTERFGIHLDLRRPLADATPVQRTIVAIASALAGWEGGPGVLVLDEPTAVLPPNEVSILLEIVKSVRDRGTSVLYVSHRLDEVLAMADRVTVLRSGRVVTTRAVAMLDAQALAGLMVGSDVDAHYRAGLQVPDSSPAVLEAQDLRGPCLDRVNLKLVRGEVLGIAGLPGSGHSELPYALAGKLHGVTGRMRVGGRGWSSIRHADSFDVSLVPADRASEAVVSQFSVAENLTLLTIGQHRRGGLLHRSSERRAVGEWIQRIQLKTSSPDAPITSLSGGNQQKVVLARCLANNPEVLILREPTAGVDVGTRQAIYELLADRAKQGLSLIVSSSDTGDLLAVCTRVVVMCNGRITRELRGAEITESALITAMEETEQV
jgi:ABC-type sugar transport system ATPase subunit